MTIVDDKGVKTKHCKKCGSDKPTTDFSRLNTAPDGLQYSCKSCVTEMKRITAEKNRSGALEQYSRVDQFLLSKRPPRELSDDEIFKRFILDESGRPIHFSMGDRTKSFQNAWSKEVSFRLKQYLVEKTPRAFEVMFQIMDSELVEPADRITAAKFIIERTMGKTPDVVLMGDANNAKPYEGILGQLESGGSREAHREKVASSRELGDGTGNHISGGIDEEIIDAEVEDFHKPSDEELKAVKQHSESGTSHHYVMEESTFGPDSEGGSETSEQGDSGQGIYSESDGGDNRRDGVLQVFSGDIGEGGEDHSVQESDEGSFLNTISQDRQEAQERLDRERALRKARSKAKGKRFAARAMGATSLVDIPFLIEYKIITNVKSPDFGKFRLRIYAPDEITEAVLRKVGESNDTTRQADALEAAAKSLMVG